MNMEARGDYLSGSQYIEDQEGKKHWWNKLFETVFSLSDEPTKIGKPSNPSIYENSQNPENNLPDKLEGTKTE